LFHTRPLSTASFAGHQHQEEVKQLYEDPSQTSMVGLYYDADQGKLSSKPEGQAFESQQEFESPSSFPLLGRETQEVLVSLL
jgi:hypothetical protein